MFVEYVVVKKDIMSVTDSISHVIRVVLNEHLKNYYNGKEKKGIKKNHYHNAKEFFSEQNKKTKN